MQNTNRVEQQRMNSGVKQMKTSEGEQCMANKKRLMFWNIAGAWNKDREFWKFIVEADFVSLSETWVEEKDMKKLENKLPQGFSWKVIPARKEAKKGRAKGGFIIGIKENWETEQDIETVEIEDGLIKTKIVTGKEKTIIWSVYNSGNIEKCIEQWDRQANLV